ncbi:MAG TPA: hypothetical protein VGG03_17840 [Thermoanaerobaculia bacterium]|jgi:hypothetical protein
MKRAFGLSICTLAFLAALSAGPIFAEEAASQTAKLAAAAAPAQPGCGQDLDLAATLSAKGEVCPVIAPENPAPEFMAAPTRGRTCRCSCGYPCKTDADCGPGGRCTAGITCC